MEDAASLRTAVEEQARALVQGDLAMFGSYALPEALARLYRSGRLGRVRRFGLMRIDEDGPIGTSVVRLDGDGSCELRVDWVRTDGRWKAVALEIPVDTMRKPLWRRLFSREKPARPTREELA